MKILYELLIYMYTKFVELRGRLCQHIIGINYDLHKP
jgi:hypothetical protein